MLIPRSPAAYPMPIDIEKQRARWRRAQTKYRKTPKGIAAKARYRSTDEYFIASHLYNITPSRRLRNRLLMQELRSGLQA